MTLTWAHDAGRVIVRNEQGEWVVVTALAAPDTIAYAGPGYVAQLTLPNGRSVVDDFRYEVGQAWPDTKLRQPLVGLTRSALTGGLGCFACDWYRPGAGLVELEARRIAGGPPYSTRFHRWMDWRIPQGVYATELYYLRKTNGGVEASVLVRNRDGMGHAFDVVYRHVWTEVTWTCRVKVILNPDGGDRCYLKEPRVIISVNLGGHGIMVRDGARRSHEYPLADLDPTRATLTIGPTANNPHNRYERHAIRLPFGLLQLGEHGWEQSGFARWRREYKHRSFPSVVENEASGRPVGDYNNEPGMQAIRITEGRREIVAGPAQTRIALPDNWEIARWPFLPVTSIMLHAWPSSIGKFDCLGGLRRVMRGDTYTAVLSLT